MVQDITLELVVLDNPPMTAWRDFKLKLSNFFSFRLRGGFLGTL